MSLRLVLIAVLLVPLIEIVLFIQLGGRLGVGWTLTWIAASAVLGAAVVALQGLSVVRYVKTVRTTRHLPPFPLWNRLMLALTGLLLILPGFFTDLLGLLLALPPLRSWIYRLLRRKPPRGGPPGPSGGRVLEGEYRVDDK